jgi:glycosyltransferase involved in cell wall biosynthesis
MPCLNEAETLKICIQKAKDFLVNNKIKGEILVGDNGSTDGSQQIAIALGVRLIDVPLKGYGAALYYASLEAKGKYLIMGDSDGSYDFSNLLPFLNKLREGYELVMGNRFSGGIGKGAMPWKNRYLGNPVLSWIGKIFFNTTVNDFHCGLRGFSKDAFLKMDLKTTGMEYASEMVIKASLLGMKITEVPTTLSPDGRSRRSHLKPWRDGWRHLRFMLLYSPNWLFIYPGLFFVLTGMLLSAWLFPGIRTVSGIHLGIHTMLYAAFLILIGYNLITFGIFTKIFSTREKLTPESDSINTFIKNYKLEHGIFAGVLLCSIGLFGSVYALYNWSEHGFGTLNPEDTMRVMIPSVLFLTLGLQVIFSSFFYSVLFLNVRK